MYFKETTRVECANCALKIIIFIYFALFLELTFYFLLFNPYHFFLIFIYFCARFVKAHNAVPVPQMHNQTNYIVKVTQQ